MFESTLVFHSRAMFKQGFESSKLLFVATFQIFYTYIVKQVFRNCMRKFTITIKQGLQGRVCSIERRKETKCSIGFERKDTSFRKMGWDFSGFKRENEHRSRPDLERISDRERYEFSSGKKERNRVGERVTPLE